MANALSTNIPRSGAPAPVVRIFAWAMLGLLAGFLINNILEIWFDQPNIFSPDGPPMLAIGVYVVCIGIGVINVLLSSHVSLRWDAWRIHNFNCFVIRAAFWVVLLVGITDSAIAFMRVENLLGNFVSEDMIRNLNRPSYVGTWVHGPLAIIGILLALVTRTLGFTWLALAIVVAELGIVISRFVFSYEQALMGDLVRYWYAALFLFASAYTLFEEGHVRVDVFYAGFKDTTRGYVNAWGSILLGMTTCWVILWIGFDGPTSIINSPVRNFEITQSGAVGMYVKYQMAIFLGIFAITMLIQFVSYFLESVADWRNEPGHRDSEPTGH